MNSSVPDYSNKISSVLVVGGGIGSIRATLDLAEPSFRVYVVDSSPSIWGDGEVG